MVMIDTRFADLPAEYKAQLPPMKTVYRSKQTPECPSGTRGRTATFEMFGMTPALERAILEGRSQEDMYHIVRKDGMLSMQEDAIIKSVKGEVPFEEVSMLGASFDMPENAEADTHPPPTSAHNSEEMG